MRLDHIAIAAETLDEGVAWVQARLGIELLGGGKHPRFGTHNRLLGLADGLYLEVIAIDPGAQVDGPRWFGLDDFSGPPRLVNWICEAEDFEAAMVHGMRHVAMQRGDLRWDMGVPPDGSLPMGGGYPTVLHWHTQSPPGRSLPDSGCALRRLTIQHPDADSISRELENVLDDARVAFEVADQIMLRAEITTPGSTVFL